MSQENLIKQLLKTIDELRLEVERLENSVLDCPYCGTSELLCGYPNKCCVVKDD